MPPSSCCPSRAPRRTCLLLLIGAAIAPGAGCGALGCPESFTEVDGFCEKVDPIDDPDPGLPSFDPPDERCDGIDNDGDELVDEPWPELGEPCGEARGECVQGIYVCADNARTVVCEGALGPMAEVCDGKDNDCDGTVDNGPAELCDGEDNDCDGLVDEGVWSLREESFDDLATVTAVEGGFAVTRLVGNQVRVETYTTGATRTGHHDDVVLPVEDAAFLESDASSGRLVIALGRHRFFALEARVDAELVPIVVATYPLHEDWDQPIDWGIYEPPHHPRITATPGRFLGHRDLITFALSPFRNGALDSLTLAPTEAAGVPYLAYFDAAGSIVVWEQSDNVRAGWLLDDGEFLVDIDVARGTHPAVALGRDGPGVAFLREGRIAVSELGGASLQCREGGLCNATVDAAQVGATSTTPTALAYDESTDTWIVAVGETVTMLGRRGLEAVAKQVERVRLGDDPPRRIDVAVSGGIAAMVHSNESGDSVLTFMGCL